MLLTVVLMAILAKAAVPTLTSQDDARLEVAAAEVREALRFARAEAMRRGQRVLFDAESGPGHVKILATSCTSSGTPKVVNDPRVKRTFDVNISDGTLSAGVVVTPQFMVSGTAWGGVIFDANGVAADACQVTGMNSKGVPEAGSGVTLALGARQVTLTLDPVTGRVTGP